MTAGAASMRCMWSMVIASLAVGGCAHSGVVNVGPDTYMIANSERGFTSGGYQKPRQLTLGKRAMDVCARTLDL
jgi:hypothetical protein